MEGGSQIFHPSASKLLSVRVTKYLDDDSIESLQFLFFLDTYKKMKCFVYSSTLMDPFLHIDSTSFFSLQHS